MVCGYELYSNQRKNEWITYKGFRDQVSNFRKLPDLRLTAAGVHVDNTPTEILQDIKNEVLKYTMILLG